MVISARQSGCGFSSSTPARRGARAGLRLRLLHGVEHRIEQVQRHHHEDRWPAGPRLAASRRCRRRARRSRPSAAAGRRGRLRRTSRVRCAAARTGRDSGRAGAAARRSPGSANTTSAPISMRRADGLGERVGGLDRNVDGAVFVLALLGVEDHRHLRQARDGPQVGVRERGGQLDRDHLAASPQQRPPQFDRRIPGGPARPGST